MSCFFFFLFLNVIFTTYLLTFRSALTLHDAVIDFKTHYILSCQLQNSKAACAVELTKYPYSSDYGSNFDTNSKNQKILIYLIHGIILLLLCWAFHAGLCWNCFRGFQMNKWTKENISFDAAVLVKERKVECLFLQVHSQEHVGYSCIDDSCGSQ